MMVFLGTMLLSRDGRPVISEKGRLWFVIIALTLANAVALHTNIRRYTTGIRVQGFDLNEPREWWWPFFSDFLSPNLLWFVGSVAFGALLWVLLMRVVPSIVRTLEMRESERKVSTAST